MEMDRELSPDEEAKLIDYLTNVDPKRRRIAEMLSMENMQERQDQDLAPIREGMHSGLKKLDSVTGAPTRKAISELLAGDKPGSVGRVVDQFGKDPETAPTWEGLAGEAGVEDETIKKGVGIVGPFLEPNLPLGPMAGMAKKIGKGKRGAEVVDFAKKLEEAGGPKPVDKIAQMHGETGKILGNSEDYLPKDQNAIRAMNNQWDKREWAKEKNRKGFGHVMEQLEAAAPKTSMRDQFLNRFGDDSPKIEKAVARVEKSGKNPYATMSETGLKNQPVPIPKFNFEAGSEIGHRGIMHSSNTKTDVVDPLMWMDSKYEVTKNALKNAKGPVRVNTSSDLIGRDDYIEALPPGSTVHIYALSPNEDLNRLLFPANPSLKRLENAVEKLKKAGVKVKLEMPTVDEYLSRAEAANVTGKKGLEFGNLGSNEAKTRIERVTGQSYESLREQLKGVLRETRLEPVDGGKIDIDPFGQNAKSKRVRPKQNRGPDDE